jgi:hypothetical protein
MKERGLVNIILHSKFYRASKVYKNSYIKKELPRYKKGPISKEDITK